MLAALAALLAPQPARADRLSERLAAERQRPPAPAIARGAFPASPVIDSATIAPDGRRIAYLAIAGERRSLWLRAVDTGAAPQRLSSRTDAQEIVWSADGKWLFLIAADSVQMTSIDGTPGSGRIAELGGAREARLIGFDPWRAAIVLLEHDGGRWRLWRVGAGGQRRLIAHSKREPIDLAIGRDGRIAFAKLADGDHHVLIGRADEGRLRTIGNCAALVRCDLIGVTPDGRGAYLASDAAGRRALFRLDAGGQRQLLHDDPARTVDLESVVVDRATGIPLIASYRGARPSLFGLTPAARAALGKMHLSADSTIETAQGAWLIRERSPRLQGHRWHLFDPGSGTTRLVLDNQPRRPSPAALAGTIGLDYRASDGMRIHGLLSVPPGRDPARLPLVTIVHGGPWSHDAPDYSALTQLLVNRGYIVFRPQFRGSTGYGRDYMRAAAADFGDGRVQSDIEEGTRYLLARGIGDPRRTAIVGASFGGYSTLQALSNGSRLYRVGIATVPPADFGWVMRWAATRTELGISQGVPFAAVLKLLGLDASDAGIARRLHAQSPRARAAAMRTPLLLIAAGRDERVPIRSVIDYAAQLKLLGAPVHIVVARKQPHSSRDRMATLANLYLIETMLQRHLGGPAATPPDTIVERWMAANFRRL